MMFAAYPFVTGALTQIVAWVGAQVITMLAY